MLADVPQTGGPQEGVHHRMQQDVCIGMGPPRPSSKGISTRLISASGLPSAGGHHIRVQFLMSNPCTLPGPGAGPAGGHLKVLPRSSTSRTFHAQPPTAEQSSVTAAPSFSAWDSAPRRRSKSNAWGV